MKDNYPTTQSIWHQLHEYVRHYDAEGQASLFADDGVWELPFAPSGIPRRIEGKDAILALSKAGMERSKQSGRRVTRYTNVTMHTTMDPNVIIAEFTLEGLAADGQSYAIPYIQVLRASNGKIGLLRDYFPSDVLQAALAGPRET